MTATTITPIAPAERGPRLESGPEADRSWMVYAACDGMGEVMFPEDGRSVAAALAVCTPCEVKVECLDYALKTKQDHGIWGGVSERGRRRILRKRAVESRGGTYRA